MYSNDTELTVTYSNVTELTVTYSNDTERTVTYNNVTEFTVKSLTGTSNGTYKNQIKINVIIKFIF